MVDPFERPPIADAPLSVVLPAYHGTVNWENVLDPWLAYLATLGREYELLVVTGAASDRPAEQVERLREKHSQLRIVEHPGSQGIGATLRTGLDAAQFPLFCYAECSTSYQPADLGRLLEMIDKVDVVTGYRVWQSLGQPRLWRRYAERGLLRCLFGLRLNDVDCFFKLFRRSILARLPIQSDGPFVHAEILAKANFLGCIMGEVPVRYEPDRAVEGLSVPAAWRADASRVFFHPEFGPTAVPP